MDYILLLLLKLLLAGLNLLPLQWRIATVELLVRAFVAVSPKHKRVAERNLELAYPDSKVEWRQDIIKRSYTSLARLIVDFARLSQLGPEWVNQHVECAFLERFKQIKAAHGESGVLIATGHLGSFELLAHSVPVFHKPIAFVVRNFKAKAIDEWWTAQRESKGNRVIARKGAFKEIAKYLQDGWDVALLFDQNVTLKHAVFVDFFGVPAATTKALALAALRAKAPIVVAAVIYAGGDRYQIEAQECTVVDIYDNYSLSFEKKVELITERASKLFEQIVRIQPEGWFWMHRRWKTRPIQSQVESQKGSPIGNQGAIY